MNRTLAFLSLAAVTLGACSTSSDANVIKVGYIGPLTGDAAAVGADLLNGARMAVDEVNAKGGINGKQIKLIVEDGRCTPSDATLAAQKLVNIDHVAAILGGQCSGEVLAAAPIAEAAQVPMISGYSSNPTVSDAGDFVFRDYPNDALKTKAMAKYFRDSGWKKVAVLSTNADFSVGFRDALRKDAGDVIVFDETVDPETKDFRTLMTRLKSMEFDGFVANAHQAAGLATMVQQFREQGLTQPIISHDVADDRAVWDAAGDAAEGMLIINAPNVGDDTDFAKAFKAKYGEPKASYVYGAYNYDAGRVLFGAMDKAADGPAIRDALYAVKNFPGITGTFGFDSHGDVTNVQYALKEVKDGKAVEVSRIKL